MLKISCGARSGRNETYRSSSEHGTSTTSCANHLPQVLVPYPMTDLNAPGMPIPKALPRGFTWSAMLGPGGADTLGAPMLVDFSSCDCGVGPATACLCIDAGSNASDMSLSLTTFPLPRLRPFLSASMTASPS